MLNKIYWLLGVGVLAYYVLWTLNGWELGTPVKQVTPPGAGRGGSGYGSNHAWFYGFGGGK